MIWEDGLGGKGCRVPQELQLRAPNQPEGIREVYMEEVIPELGFGGWIQETSRRKGEGGLFRAWDTKRQKCLEHCSWMKQNWRHDTWFWENGTYALKIYLSGKSIFNYKFLVFPLYMNIGGRSDNEALEEKVRKLRIQKDPAALWDSEVISISRYENWSSERFRYLPRVTQLLLIFTGAGFEHRSEFTEEDSIQEWFLHWDLTESRSWKVFIWHFMEIVSSAKSWSLTCLLSVAEFWPFRIWKDLRDHRETAT